MPISLKSVISNSSGNYLYLSSGNLVSTSAGDESGGALVANSLSASANISSVLTQMISVDVLADEMLLIKHLQLSGFDTGTGGVDYEIEIDGKTVITGSVNSTIATNVNGFYVIGTGTTVGTGSLTASSYYLHNNILKDVLVKNNLKVRAFRSGENTASVGVRYVKLRRD